MRLLLLISAFFILASTASAEETTPWQGSWKPKKLICPFGCSVLMRELFQTSKGGKFEFGEKKIEDPSGMGLSCSANAELDYSGIQATTVGAYLDQWSNNEDAMKKPKVRAKLPQALGLKASQAATAGLIRCKDARGQAQNLMIVDAKHAFAIYEENAYWELARQ